MNPYIYHLEIREANSHDSVEYTCHSLKELKQVVGRLKDDVMVWEDMRQRFAQEKGKPVTKNTYFIQVARSKKRDVFRYTCFSFENLLKGIQKLKTELLKGVFNHD